METLAIVIDNPGKLDLRKVALREPNTGEVIIETQFSGVSTGTERLFWNGEMPFFPGMGYPLVPGYETVGVVVDNRASRNLRLAIMYLSQGQIAIKTKRVFSVHLLAF